MQSQSISSKSSIILPQENQTREQWKETFFIIFLIGSSIGLSNIWRASFKMIQYNPQSFIFFFFLIYLTIIPPMFISEVKIGQYFQAGPGKSYQYMSQYFYGVGYVQSWVSFTVGSYYVMTIVFGNIYLMYILFYLQSTVPWSDENEYYQNICKSNAANNFYQIEISRAIDSNCKEYSKTEIQYLDWKIALSSAFCFLFMYLALYKGKDSFQKIIYITVFCPFILLAVFFGIGFKLDGYKEAIKQYYTFNIQYNQDQPFFSMNTIQMALSQAIFSTSIASGINLSYGSHLPQSKGVIKASIIVIVIDFIATFFCGSIVIGVLAYINQKYKDFGEIDSYQLLFITYPLTTLQIQGGQFMLIAFFLTIFLIGIDSVISYLIVIGTVVKDREQNKYTNKSIFAVICGSMYLLTLLYATNARKILIHWIDYYVSNLLFFIIVIMQNIICYWLFKLEYHSLNAGKLSYYSCFVGILVSNILGAIVYKYQYVAGSSIAVSGSILSLIISYTTCINKENWVNSVIIGTSSFWVDKIVIDHNENKKWIKTIFNYWFSISNKFITITLIPWILLQSKPEIKLDFFQWQHLFGFLSFVIGIIILSMGLLYPYNLKKIHEDIDKENVSTSFMSIKLNSKKISIQ